MNYDVDVASEGKKNHIYREDKECLKLKRVEKIKNYCKVLQSFDVTMIKQDSCLGAF